MPTAGLGDRNECGRHVPVIDSAVLTLFLLVCPPLFWLPDLPWRLDSAIKRWGCVSSTLHGRLLASVRWRLWSSSTPILTGGRFAKYALQNHECDVETETSGFQNWFEHSKSFIFTDPDVYLLDAGAVCCHLVAQVNKSHHSLKLPPIDCGRIVGGSFLAKDMCLLVVNVEFYGTGSRAQFHSLLLDILVSMWQ